MRGKIKWFSTQKGYGFIAPDAGPDLFLRIDSLRGTDSVEAGDTVEFEVRPGIKGPMAHNVRKV